MKSNKKELLALVEKFSACELLVLGDLILDRYIWGSVDRISPEAPVVVVQVKEESSRLGGAANVAHNLVTLGAKARLIGVIGEDSAADEVRELLSTIGINHEGVIADSSRPTTVKTRVVAHSQQVVRVDHEQTHQLSTDLSQQVVANIKLCRDKLSGIIVSDYGKGFVTPVLFKEFQSWRASSGIGLRSRAVLVDPKDPNYDLYRGASIIKPNRKEAEAATGIKIRDRKSAFEAARMIMDRGEFEAVLITLGGDGMVLVSTDPSQRELEIDTMARKVYDVSGAGDTVSAVYSLALAAGGSLLQAADLANIAAGIVVGEVGTVAVQKSKLEEAIAAGGSLS